MSKGLHLIEADLEEDWIAELDWAVFIRWIGIWS